MTNKKSPPKLKPQQASKTKKKQYQGKLSLYGVKPEEALKAFMQVKKPIQS